jgi:hypothetical protein
VLSEVDLTAQVIGILPIANGGSGAVTTTTSDLTITNSDGWVINNKSGSTCTITLPSASTWPTRRLTFKNLQAQTVVSASSNVAPIGSATPGTAILPATVGSWATLVSDGTNWVVMAS